MLQANAAAFEQGHADFGPQVEDGQVVLKLRDDTVVPAQWRDAQDVVFSLGDAATQQLPEGKDFEFTGAKPGDTVWVVPQTEKPQVPWLGWNTQAPELASVAEQGVNFEFLGHQGPGTFSLFLQDGGLGGPEPLFLAPGDSAWVDNGTHAHANWVFSQPGTHLVRIKVTAGTQEATADLRFAVGDTSESAIQAAQSAQWEGHSEQESYTKYLLFALAGVVLLLLVIWRVRARNS
ncbi:choice-of-anchor M domain-containing protein [Corynebacterium pseudopelargi]|nr:choice-of-anchor M domain-containing protein [Corynebacterium pseudopelargi]